MTARNDVTGDKLQTKTTSKDYLDNYDKIFGTPLYNIPPNSWVENNHGHKFFFEYTKDRYAVCREVGGGISHYDIGMKVKISENQNAD